MEQFCQLAGGREDTWYATNIEIVDYMADAARLQYTAAGDKVCNPNAQSIWVEVDGRHYEIPAGKEAAAHLCSTAPIFNFSLHTGVTALDHAGDNGMALTGAFQVGNHFPNGTTGVQFT